jgi:ribosomal-protein-alanine N-acetyltransferase
MADTTFSIRPVSESDLENILKLETTSHQAPWSLESLGAELVKPFSYFWVITDDETDEQIAGYIVFWIIDRECRVLNVVVSQEARGLGYGKLLIRSAIREALRQGCTQAALEVRKSNEAAVQLYQSLGFTISRIQKSFYSNGEDAYLMDLPLEGDKETF